MEQFLPVWLLGAPLVLAIVSLFRTPQVRRTNARIAS